MKEDFEGNMEAFEEMKKFLEQNGESIDNVTIPFTDDFTLPTFPPKSEEAQLEAEAGEVRASKAEEERGFESWGLEGNDMMPESAEGVQEAGDDDWSKITPPFEVSTEAP